MKKIITVVLGLSLASGMVVFAQTTDTTTNTDTNTMSGTGKKHHKKHKGSGTDTSNTSDKGQTSK
jgi:hypothetical protein